MKSFANQSSIRITSSTWTSQKTVSENSVWPSIYRSCPQLLPKILVQFQVRTRILSKITRNSVKTIRIVNQYRVMSTHELSETITRPFGNHSRAFLLSFYILFDTLWDFRQMLDPRISSYFNRFSRPEQWYSTNRYTFTIRSATIQKNNSYIHDHCVIR